MKKIFNKHLGLILFAGALIVGLNSYKGYGVSWDEGDQRHLGYTTYNYLFHGIDSIKYCNNKEYGVALELPLTILEKTLRIKDSRDILLMRHLVIHIFFLLGVLAFFLLIDFLYHNKLLAVIGFLILVTTPLIYGHSFFNSKDAPFLSMFIICFLTTALAFKKNNLKWYILLGVSCAILMNLRIMGILLVGCIMIFFILDYLALKHDKAARKKTFLYFLVFTGTAFLLLLITWPYLYSSPRQNFIDAFKHLSQWSWKGQVLFWGTSYRSKNIPPYYGISWFCISNPVIYIALGSYGLLYFVIRFIRNSKQFIFDKTLRNQSLFASCFVGPLILLLIFHSVIFDAWRHIYFIYPPFILIGIFGLDYLLKTKAKWPVLVLVIAAICYSGYYMVSNYPYEHIYFNEFVKKDPPEYLRKNFELDYWGTSYTRAFEYILKNDTSRNIIVAVEGVPVGRENTWLLKPEDRKRIYITSDVSKADYFASYYRGHPEDYDFKKKEVFSIKVENSTIMSVFKMK
ncbi:MAG: ArnT family glycosyltransferase [Bacteroidia bacterium]